MGRQCTFSSFSRVQIEGLTSRTGTPTGLDDTCGCTLTLFGWTQSNLSRKFSYLFSMLSYFSGNLMMFGTTYKPHKLEQVSNCSKRKTTLLNVNPKKSFIFQETRNQFIFKGTNLWFLSKILPMQSHLSD